MPLETIVAAGSLATAAAKGLVKLVRQNRERREQLKEEEK